jgi:YggT family protein
MADEGSFTAGPVIAFYGVLRFVVLAAFLASLVLAIGSWAVTTRRIPPFGFAARWIRRLSDPLLVPLEGFLVRRGRNPQHAPWWLLGFVTVGGIVLLTVVQWLLATAASVVVTAGSGTSGVLRLVVYLSGQVVLLALIVRVVGSWFGAGRYNRWMRPAYVLTDWIVRPLQRFVPPFGMIDITPLVAWLLLDLVLGIVVRAL